MYKGEAGVGPALILRLRQNQVPVLLMPCITAISATRVPAVEDTAADCGPEFTWECAQVVVSVHPETAVPSTSRSRSTD